MKTTLYFVEKDLSDKFAGFLRPLADIDKIELDGFNLVLYHHINNISDIFHAFLLGVTTGRKTTM